MTISVSERAADIEIALINGRKWVLISGDVRAAVNYEDVKPYIVLGREKDAALMKLFQKATLRD